MPDDTKTLAASEAAAEQARSRLTYSLARLREQLTPAQVVRRGGEAVSEALKPAIEPIARQARDSKYLIGLGLATTALAFGIGRGSVSALKSPAPPLSEARSDDVNRVSRGSDIHISNALEARKNPASLRRSQRSLEKAKETDATRESSLGRALLMGSVGVAIGSALAAVIPRSDFESDFAGKQAPLLKEWGRRQLERRSAEMFERTIDASNLARTLGIGMGLIGLVAAQLGSSAPKTRG